MAGFLDARPRVGYFYSGKTMESIFAERVRKFCVKDVKGVPVVISNSASLYDAIVTIFVEDVGTLFVINDQNHLVGVVSRKDLLKSTLGKVDLEKIPVDVVMTRMPNIIVTTPEESVWEAARKMVEYEIDSLPVVKQVEPGESSGRPQYQIIGRITKTTITKLFVEMGQM